MKNVFNFSRTSLLGISIILLIICSYWLVRSCSKSNKSNIQDINGKNIEKINNENSNIETLEKKDSIIESKIKEIDSLRLELGVLGSDADELYKFLSNRYDKNPKR
jgi:hypothetical protein